MDTDKITTLVGANPRLTVREIQEILDMLCGSVVAHQTIDAAKYCNSIVWGKPFSRSTWNWSTGEEWPSITTLGHAHLCAPAKNYSSFSKMFCRILRIILTLLHRIIIFSVLFKILLEKIFQIRMSSKFTLSGFSLKNLRRSEKRRSLIYPIVGSN